ncbi:MAG: Sua5/YciO/YrdC/YwlC family protein [Thermoanaerobaculia bacterium]|nr:Sua5/YciO/YrdC/YwlC family protein [Thermoanaerobaculia bacterium]
METERHAGRAGNPRRRFEHDGSIGWSADRAPVFGAAASVTFPPLDRPVCEACATEIFDASSRRFLYPFTSCSECGPRRSILERGLFLRENSSMAGYEMCKACREEYETPGGRRFHDEAISCPSCGPTLRSITAGVTTWPSDPGRLAVGAILDEMTIAIRDERRDSFCCDATSSVAVSRLRSRCGAFDVPLAVIVRDLDEASRVAALTSKDVSLLTSVERPVVLVSIRTDSPLTGEVAAGNRLVGLLLPYSPLHLLLLKESGRPLVIFPAGVPDAPPRMTEPELLETADLLLVADRSPLGDRPAPELRNDEFAQVAASRRITLDGPVSRVILACGAGSPGSVCIASGDEALIAAAARSEDTFESILHFEQAVEAVKGESSRAPEVVVHDLDERFYSTRFALDQVGVAHVAVQHHHAHMAACLAEYGETETALGVVFDFGGLGPDETMWGGEILRGGVAGIERLATFRPIVLAGEHVSSRQIWRVALAMMDDVWSGEPPLHAIPMFRTMPRRGIEVVRRVLDAGPTVRSHAIGLQLEALAAILFGKLDSPRPGALAARLDAVADRTEHGRYPIVIRDGAEPWEIDFRPVVKCAVTEFIEGTGPATIAARVRNSIVSAVAEVLLAHGGDSLPVVVTGDYFECNQLAVDLAGSLGPRANVLRPGSLPGDDRSLAFGQVVVTDALLRRVASPRPARAVSSCEL